MTTFTLNLGARTYKLQRLTPARLLAWGRVLERNGGRLSTLDQDKSIAAAEDIEHELRTACYRILREYDHRFTRKDLDIVPVADIYEAIRFLHSMNTRTRN